MLKIKESWSLFSLKNNGKDYIVRCNAGLWNIVGNQKYPYKVGIAVPLLETDHNGFPAKTSNEILNKLEDLIINTLQKNNESLFAGTITGAGIKEFFLYTANPENVEKKVNEIKQSFKNYDLQLSIQRDEKWKVFSQLCPQSS